MIKNKTIRKILRYVLMTPAIVVVVIWFCNIICMIITNPLEFLVAIVIIAIVVIMVLVAIFLVD